MRLLFSDLKKYEVETRSGEMLGRVADVVFQTDGQLVAQYVVKSGLLGTKEYLVSREQIVRFEERKMIVDDMMTEIQTKKEEQKDALQAAEPVMMREES